MKTEHKPLDAPEETREFPLGHADLIKLGDLTLSRATFEPGWRWSECLRPIVGTDLCLLQHQGYVLSGCLHILMEDGREFDMREGDAFAIEAGHDGYVVGDDACVVLEFSGTSREYAKPGAGT